MTHNPVETLAGLALMLASFGGVVSMMILLSAKLRKQSEAPAFLCLMCSVIYVMAFVYSADQKRKHPISTVAAAHQTAPPAHQAAATRTYSFGNVLQSSGD